MADQQPTPSSPPSRPSRGSVRISNPDIFSDEFALAPFELVDGHQTVSSGRNESHDVGRSTPASETPRRSLSIQRALESPSGSFRRTRGSQRSDLRSSMSSRLDDHASQVSYPPHSVGSVSDSASTQHRSVNTISTFGFPRAQSPYQGTTGPSHPYGMYPQDIGLTRTPSMATTSTIRQPERSYSGPNGPTQPYGMYSQNIVPEDDQGSVGGMGGPIGAGFRQNYERRLGPDGEDVDDIIGPDGYTEQLPPYTRYPNGVPPKYSSGIGSVRSAPPVQSEESQETLHSPRILHSSQTLNSPQAEGNVSETNPFNDSSTHLSSTAQIAAISKDDSGNFKERVREKSKRKVCCGILPCWVLAVILLIIVLAVVLGGLIGGFAAHKHGVQKGQQEALQSLSLPSATAATATITQTIPAPPDASPLSSLPPNLPPLPTGLFSLALTDAANSSDSCLTVSSQSPAWDCETGADLLINITHVPPNLPVISLTYPASPTPQIRYGAQPPQLNGPSTMYPMNDKDDFTKGPAFGFQQSYDKIIIVRTEDLLPNSKRSFIRRWFGGEDGLDDPLNLQERDNSQWTSDSMAAQGDKPWYCFWNGTIIEGFIYVNPDSDTDPSASGAAATSVNAATSGAAATSGSSDSWPPPPSAGPSASYSTPASQVKRQSPATSSPAPYPRLIKIEERRNSQNNIQPYCQQMQILNDYRPGPLTNQQGQNITIQLSEVEPTVQHQVINPGPGGPPVAPVMPTNSQPGKRRLKRTATVSPCQCEWMSGS